MVNDTISNNDKTIFSEKKGREKNPSKFKKIIQNDTNNKIFISYHRVFMIFFYKHPFLQHCHVLFFLT